MFLFCEMLVCKIEKRWIYPKYKQILLYLYQMFLEKELDKNEIVYSGTHKTMEYKDDYFTKVKFK